MVPVAAVDKVLIVKTGDTLRTVADERGNFDDWIIRGLGLSRQRIEVVDVFRNDSLPHSDRYSGVVVTGSSAYVTDREPWSERTASWLVDVVRAQTPLLGICYGHQLLAHGHGGRVDRNPLGREIGTIEVRLSEAASRDPLLQGFPPALQVQATHLESVVELPPGAQLLASSDRDPHQAFSLGPAAWGVQFHPEFDAHIIRGYIEARRDLLRGEGQDADSLRAAAVDSTYGDQLLRRFSELLR